MQVYCFMLRVHKTGHPKRWINKRGEIRVCKVVVLLPINMNIGDIFNLFFFYPVTNLLVLIIKGLQVVGLPGALGFSVVVLTIIIKLVLWPFYHAQIKSSQKLVQLKPELDKLKDSHRDDKKALQLAQMELYKKHGVNPAGGCLPALIQIPVFIALYQAIGNVLPGLSDGSLDKLNSMLYVGWMHLVQAPDPSFFGLNLATKPSEFASQGLFLLLVPLMTAALTFVQSMMTMPKKALKVYPTDTPKEVKEKGSVEDSMMQVQAQMVYMMPLMIGYFAFSFPVGLAIYWNTYTILGIIQQYGISGWGGLADFYAKTVGRYIR